jgi:hypothetical protein
MVLLDHFRPPLSSRRHWHAFHNAWATYLATDLNQKLPSGFFAEPNVQFGIEIDVATFEESETNFPQNCLPQNNFTQNNLAQNHWSPPVPAHQISFSLTEEIVEISVLSDSAGPTLRSAIELVSPANKDRPEQRKAFLSKCETYLREGISLVIVDVVTTRKTDFHYELLERLQPISIELTAKPPSQTNNLYAVAYHPIQIHKQSKLDIWYETFEIGSWLPVLPLWFDRDRCLPLMLQETYEQTCRSQRITVENY